jgi:hypothetical protein
MASASQLTKSPPEQHDVRTRLLQFCDGVVDQAAGVVGPAWKSEAYAIRSDLMTLERTRNCQRVPFDHDRYGRTEADGKPRRPRRGVTSLNACSDHARQTG